MKLDSKVGLITGGSSGIGFETAKRALEEGAKSVVITGQNLERLHSAQETLAQIGHVIALPWQAENLESTPRLVEKIQEHHKQVDFIFANAGVCWDTPLGQVTADTVQRQFLINFTAPLLLIQSLVPLMKEGGSIALTTSCLHQLGTPGYASYAASKAALRSLARTLSAELKSQNIRVNSLAPGPFETAIYKTFGMGDGELDHLKQQVAANVPVGRFGRVDEIADIAVFLLSDGTSYMLGEEITVDGGWTNL